MNKSEGIEINYRQKNSKEIGLEIAYNEEFRFHALIKNNTGEKVRKGIIIDQDGNLINSFPFSSFKESEDITAVEYLDSFLEAHLHKGIYNAMLSKQTIRDKNNEK